MHTSRSSKQELIVRQEEFYGHCEEEDFGDDGGSTLTIGRNSTISKESDVNEIIQIETANERELPQKRYNSANSAKYKHDEMNESCISPFFHVVYIFLGCLIIILLGLNFWFGFHLLFLIALLSVIALLVLVLTEFSEFHNISV
jgi:Flp pilus assembly protein TadB